MGIESTRPYAFERVFEFNTLDTERGPQDQALQILSLKAELAQHLANAERALAEARAQGFAAGLEQARRERDAALVKAETMLIDGIARLEDMFVATETRVAAAATEVAMVAAEAIAARAIAADPAQAIDEAIGRVLGQIGFRESLHIHAHPSLVEPLQALIDNRVIRTQRPLAIALHADPALPLGDAHILWDAGGLHLDVAARRAAVSELLGLDTPPA
jgi:flagellar assembly protein FliH